ncbi:MAG: helix-turn-helix domain-containing protein [Roseburia sp.]|nr:helix-turn-helix domain-containing protein [Lachnospiraceae bacterium]MCM1568861.1 helix-turn-helix domain-containing protein [Roseburia sp.]
MQKKKSINVEIGANIKRERENAGYTQDEFSELIGLGTKSLSAAERGVVGLSLTSLRKICQVLSIPSDALIFGRQPDNDISDLMGRMERLSPAQLDIAKKVFKNLLAAFALDSNSQNIK